MSNRWAVVPLREVLLPVERPIAPQRGTSYKQAGVRLWGGGVYERLAVDGGDTQYKTLFRIQANDIVVNKIWARNGSVGVVPDFLDGCYVSGEFPTYEPIRDKLNPRWFHWVTKTKQFWQQCDERSRGTSGKNRIRPEQFLSITFPLPSLLEQDRATQRLDEVIHKIQQTQQLQLQVINECDQLCRATAADVSFGPLTLTPMSELVKMRPLDVGVETDGLYEFAGVFSFGQGVFKGQVKSGMDFAYKRLTRLRVGDFVYPKLMAWEGAFGVVPLECDELVVSPEFPVFEIDQQKVLPEVLDVFFKSPEVWPKVAAKSTGTNLRRKRLNPGSFLNFQIPLPPMATQIRLREVKEKADMIKKLHKITNTELKLLIPSIIDQAIGANL